MRGPSFNIKAVSVVGLGKLGFSLVVALARRGFNVVGTDINRAFVRKVQRGISPIDETDTQRLLTLHRGRIKAVASAGEAVASSDATLVIVPTPSDSRGVFSSKHLLAAMREIGAALASKPGYHIVVITSTVMPGTTDGAVKPLLERLSGKKCGRDFGLVYNPEFIALGSVVRDILNPDFVLVGESDAAAGDVIERFYRRACEKRAPVMRMKPVEAEIAKISLNCYCTTKIAFANMLAEIAERVPGADARAIANAIGLDRRIGRPYLLPGLGFGGPCFPRDNVAFRAFARALGIRVPIPEAVHSSNLKQPRRIAALVGRLLPRRGRIAVLGLAYKPNTSVVTESQAMEIAAILAGRKGYSVSVYDPMAMKNAAKVLGARVVYAGSAEACLRGADVCVLATPWSEFRRIPAATFARRMRSARVVDCWQCLEEDTRAGLAGYFAVGLGEQARNV